MEKDEKLETLRKWLESGASDFDHEKSKILLTKIYDMSESQLDAIYRMYEESFEHVQKNTKREIYSKKMPSGSKFGIFIIFCLLIFFSYKTYNDNKIKNNVKNAMVGLVCDENFLDQIQEISEDPYSMASFGKIMEIRSRSEKLAKENGFKDLDEMNKKSDKFRHDNDFTKEVEIQIQNKCGSAIQNFSTQMMFND